MIKVKNVDFGKKVEKKFGQKAPQFLLYKQRGNSKEQPQKEKRGAGNEKVTMAENESRTLFGSPDPVSAEPTEWRFVYRLMVLPERYGRYRQR